MADDPFYVIDSSSLIDMKLYYRMSSFKTLWVRINDLIDKDGLQHQWQFLKSRI